MKRLGPALVASVAVHLALLLGGTPGARRSVPLTFSNTVELGLETARPATAPTPDPVAPETPAPAPPSPPAAPARPRPPRPPRVRPPTAARPPESPAPEASSETANIPPETAATPPDEMPEDAGLTAALDSDAGIDPQALAAADAGPGFAPTVGVARAAGALGPAIPVGSVVTLLLRTDRLRDNPNAPAVRALLAGIPDWRAVLGGTELDPLQDFNSILFATPNPFVTVGQTPDVMALVRTRVPRGFLRASVEQMAGARPAQDPDAGTLRARFDPDGGGPLPRVTQPVWSRRGAAEVATVDRYIGPLSVVLLADDLAAIAPAARVPALLAVLGARNGPFDRANTGPARGRAGRLVTTLEARNVRALVRAQGALAGAVPARVELTLYETRPGGQADGGAELAGVLAYDSPAQAAAAARLLSALLEDAHDMLDEQARDPRLRLGALALGVHFDALHEILRAFRVGPEGNDVRLEADLSAAQVRELLHLQRLAGLLR